MFLNDDTTAAASRGLLDLPLVLVRTIFELVYGNGSSRNALSALRRTSRICRRECERLMFRSISLSDTDSRSLLKSRELLKRLQDPNDELAEHVRELWLGPFEKDGYFAGELLQYQGDGISMSYSAWFSMLEGTLRKALQSPVTSEPQALASTAQHEMVAEMAALDLAPGLLNSMKQLLREPDSIPPESSFAAALWDDECYVSPVLERATRRMAHLRSITWNSYLLFPRDVLRTLQQNAPNAIINVDQPSQTQSHMDCTLLSSPQIYSAKVWIHSAPNDGPEKNCNEYGLVKHCLVRGNSIKRLAIRCDTYKITSPLRFADGSAFLRWNRVAEGPMNFGWQEGDRFPALEELKLPHPEYYLPEDHCDMWAHCMDWSHLRRLDVGASTPKHLFVALTGRVPQLQSLRFGNWPTTTSVISPDCQDLLLIKPFLDSIYALQDLSFSCQDVRQHLYIFEAQKSSLRHLKIEENHMGFVGRAVEEEGLVLRLLEKFPGLTSGEFAWCNPPFKAEWDAHLTPRQKLGLMKYNRQVAMPPRSNYDWILRGDGLDLRGM